jgi:hypothetical protein
LILGSFEWFCKTQGVVDIAGVVQQVCHVHNTKGIITRSPVNAKRGIFIEDSIDVLLWDAFCGFGLLCRPWPRVDMD